MKLINMCALCYLFYTLVNSLYSTHPKIWGFSSPKPLMSAAYEKELAKLIELIDKYCRLLGELFICI